MPALTVVLGRKFDPRITRTYAAVVIRGAWSGSHTVNVLRLLGGMVIVACIILVAMVRLLSRPALDDEAYLAEPLKARSQ